MREHAVNIQFHGSVLRVRSLWQYWMDPSKPWRGRPLPIDDQVWQLLEASVSISMGNGAIASFWHDDWLFDKLSRVSFNELLCLQSVLKEH
jgi:hypothetical protein